jgi:hypothetical protein
LAASARRNPGWAVVVHDELCRSAPTSFPALAETLGLEWTDRASEFLDESNRPGRRFETARLAQELPGRWRDRLSIEQVADIRATLADFSPAVPALQI